jgi:hypothetical protein
VCCSGNKNFKRKCGRAQARVPKGFGVVVVNTWKTRYSIKTPTHLWKILVFMMKGVAEIKPSLYFNQTTSSIGMPLK